VDWSALFGPGGIVGLLVVAGGGLRWFMNRQDAKEKALETRAQLLDAEREKDVAEMRAELADLRLQMKQRETKAAELYVTALGYWHQLKRHEHVPDPPEKPVWGDTQ
jgi:hypothetical protein